MQPRMGKRILGRGNFVITTLHEQVWERLRDTMIKDSPTKVSHRNYKVMNHGVLTKFYKESFGYALDKENIIVYPPLGNSSRWYYKKWTDRSDSTVYRAIILEFGFTWNSFNRRLSLTMTYCTSTINQDLVGFNIDDKHKWKDCA
mmetsp:Transcript_101235/g.151665  ORF Transcript_101235/g.151665 Transcript_101235/m.151665 type:complete len:145 (+) Transcript_101235:173-607(+)